MISDVQVLEGIEQKVLFSLPTEEEKLKVGQSVGPTNVSEPREVLKVSPISEQPELLALDTDLVLDLAKKGRHTKRRFE